MRVLLQAPAVDSPPAAYPAGRRAARVTGGRYDAARETVIVEPFRGTAKITLFFDRV